jgi:RNA polymerase sigma-70 factor (ECF subfamily)
METTRDGGRSDEELVRRIAGGDREAFRVLYDRHLPWLAARIARRCADRGLVEEVVQDTFVAVWHGAGSYGAEGRVAAWLWGIAIRVLLKRLRGRPLPLPLPEVGTLDLVGSAEEQVLLSVRYGDLAGALGRLSPELQAVVQATVLDGLTTREAARLLGIPAGTVKTRMLRARRRLREELA